MKNLSIILIFLFMSNTGYCQEKIKKDINLSDSTQLDTTKFKPLKKVNISKHEYKFMPKPLYRPTRLGSSSPLYSTYKKNNYGAGAITTNPNKSGRSFIYSTPNKNAEPLIKSDGIPVKKNSIFPAPVNNTL